MTDQTISHDKCYERLGSAFGKQVLRNMTTELRDSSRVFNHPVAEVVS